MSGLDAHYNTGRMRLIVCRGCPTVECTCFTELEADLLAKTTEMINAAGGGTIVQALEWCEDTRTELTQLRAALALAEAKFAAIEARFDDGVDVIDPWASRFAREARAEIRQAMEGG